MNIVYLKWGPNKWHSDPYWSSKFKEQDLIAYRDAECKHEILRWVGSCNPKFPTKTQKTVTLMYQRYKIEWIN